MGELEARARGKAAQAAGRYLSKKIGTTDISELDDDQLDTFVECIVTVYGEALHELACEPFPAKG